MGFLGQEGKSVLELDPSLDRLHIYGFPEKNEKEEQICANLTVHVSQVDTLKEEYMLTYLTLATTNKSEFRSSLLISP